MTADELRDGVFALHTARFGRVGELMIKGLARLGAGQTRFHDLYDELQEHRVEVKFSRALAQNEVAVEPGTLLAAIDGARAAERMVAFEDSQLAVWDCNIQQVKRSEFDTLYYGVFFSDLIVSFRARSAVVGTLPGYSDRQHKGNVGEGQFHLKPSNLEYHLDNHHYATVTYEELLSALSTLDEGVSGGLSSS